MVQRAMLITLTSEQQAWCESHVASGDFASVEEAARQLVDERIAERAAEESDDLAWAKPYVNEARAAVARVEFVSLEEHKAHNAAFLASLKARPGYRAQLQRQSQHDFETSTQRKLTTLQ
jgi:antitoxin ParD1/3/4